MIATGRIRAPSPPGGGLGRGQNNEFSAWRSPIGPPPPGRGGGEGGGTWHSVRYCTERIAGFARPHPGPLPKGEGPRGLPFGEQQLLTSPSPPPGGRGALQTPLRGGLALLAALLLLAFTTTGGLVKEGNRALEKGDPKAALDAYAQALERAPGSPEILFDTGLARAAGGDTGAAREAFLAALAGGGEGLRGPIEYNVGNTYFAEEDYASAAKAYRAALAANPADQDAKANLELTLRRIAEQEKQQQDQAQQDQPQQDQQQGGEDGEDQKPPPPQQDQSQADDQPSQEDKSAGESREPDQPQDQDQADSGSQAGDQANDQTSQQEQAQAPADDQHQEAQGGAAQPAGAAQMDPQQVDQLLDALQSQEEALQQQVRARLVPVAPRQLEQDW